MSFLQTLLAGLLVLAFTFLMILTIHVTRGRTVAQVIRWMGRRLWIEATALGDTLEFWAKRRRHYCEYIAEDDRREEAKCQTPSA